MSTEKFALLALPLALAVVAAGCSSEGEGGPSAAGRPPVAVEVAAAASGEIDQSIEVVGSLKAEHEATIQSEYSGIVSDVYVTEWVGVTRGQPLARLDSRDAENALAMARAALAQAQAQENRAERELERTVKLENIGLATQQELDDAHTARDAAVASTEAAKAQLLSAETYAEKQLIRSPLDGVVSFRGVSVGDRVENMGGGVPMFRIVDNDLLELHVTVPSVKMATLRVGQPLAFSTDAYPNRSFTGKVMTINPAVDEATRSVTVAAEVSNPDGELKVGMFVKGKILTGVRHGVLLVPRSALLSWDVGSGQAETFVVDGEAVTRRSVRTGVVAGDGVEILQGLRAGEQVVTRGAFTLRDGDRVDVVGAVNPETTS